MWVWRDDLGSGGETGGSGGWRLDAYGTWVWDEPSVLERAGAGTGALRGRGAPVRELGGRRGDRALAALEHADPTPIFNELSTDRSRRGPRRETVVRGSRAAERSWRERDAVSIPEPHPGSGALPVQDPYGGSGSARGLAEVPTVPPPALDGSSSVARRRPSELPETAASAEDELRRRAERRRRPLTSVDADGDRDGGRHTWRRDEVRTGRHALRR